MKKILAYYYKAGKTDNGRIEVVSLVIESRKVERWSYVSNLNSMSRNETHEKDMFNEGYKMMINANVFQIFRSQYALTDWYTWWKLFLNQI